MTLIPRQSHQQPPKAYRNHDRSILLILHIKDTSMHNVFVIVGQGGFCRSIGRVTEMICRRSVQVQRTGQDQRELVSLPDLVNFTINIQQKITFKGSSSTLQTVHSLEFVSVGIECCSFKDIFKECNFRGGFHFPDVQVRYVEATFGIIIYSKLQEGQMLTVVVAKCRCLCKWQFNGIYLVLQWN